MNRFHHPVARARFLNLTLVLAVAAELLSAPTARARTIDVWAMIRDVGVRAMAKAAVLPIEELWSRDAFAAATLPSERVLESYGHVIVPYGTYAYSPLSHDLVSLNPDDPVYGGVRCSAHFDDLWMVADAGPNAFEAGLQSDSNVAPPLPAPSPPVAAARPGVRAPDRGGPAMDEAGDPARAETVDEPAAAVYCRGARPRRASGLVLANGTPRRDAAGLCRREIGGEGEMEARLASAGLCEWRCETRPDEGLLAGLCSLPRTGNELEFAVFDFHPPRAEATIHRRAPRGTNRTAALGGTPGPCGGGCDRQVDAAPSSGFCPRWPQADALEPFQANWSPARVKKTRKNRKPEPQSDSIGSEMALELTSARFDARRAGAMTWIAFAGNSETAAPAETPRLCVRLRKAPVGAAPSAGLCRRSPGQDWPELARAIFDRRAQALTCDLQEDGEGAAAAARETPRLCEWRREPGVPLAGAAELCPNPRRMAAVQRDMLDFSPVSASVTAANLCRRGACAILVFDTDGPRPASRPGSGGESGFPAPAPGVVDLGRARPTLAAGNTNGAGVWPSVVTGTQKPYCPMGTTPLTYAQLQFLFESSSPVPEPSTWALMLGAFLGLGGVGWRRRRRGGEIG
jgi:hypothetical protein